MSYHFIFTSGSVLSNQSILRNYSIYEGHSWASADADFSDGNNQESTSEALNAWYSIWLWGKATNNTHYQDLGSFLFANELQGTKAYWFGINNPFPNNYEHNMASIVWGGKRDFATWFSGQAMHIYGIQILPITPASTYLQDIARQSHINEIRKLTEEDILSHEWADIYLAYFSFINPQMAASLIDNVDTTNGLKLRSLLLQTVYSNLEQ